MFPCVKWGAQNRPACREDPVTLALVMPPGSLPTPRPLPLAPDAVMSSGPTLSRCPQNAPTAHPGCSPRCWALPRETRSSPRKEPLPEAPNKTAAWLGRPLTPYFSGVGAAPLGEPGGPGEGPACSGPHLAI